MSKTLAINILLGGLLGICVPGGITWNFFAVLIIANLMYLNGLFSED